MNIVTVMFFNDNPKHIISNLIMSGLFVEHPY